MQPPLLDKELIDLFMDTLQNPYFERLVGSVLSNFSHLVSIGEHIESFLKSGRIQGASSSQTSEIESLSNSQKEEDDEINAVMTDVGYSYGAQTMPYDPPSFQWSQFPA